MTALYANGKFNKSAIAKAAWEAITNYYGPRAGSFFGSEWKKDRLAVLRYGFKHAWELAHRAKTDAEALAAIPVEVKTGRIEALKAEITNLQYLPIGMNAAVRRQALQSEIARLAA